MDQLRQRWTLTLGAVLTALVAAAAIALAMTVPHDGASTGSSRAAASVIPTERLAAGPYQLAITRSAAAGGERADIRLLTGDGGVAAGKAVSGLLVYEGNAAGHEHHDILVSQEPEPGHYVLDLREAVAGPWC